MAFLTTTKLVLLMGFLFFEKVLQSMEYILIVVILFFVSVIVFAFFLLRTMPNQPRRSFQIGNMTRGNRKTEPMPKRKSSTGDRYRTHQTNPADGDVTNYVEFDDGPNLPSIGNTASNLSGLPNIQEEPLFSGRDVVDQGPTNTQTMSPIICETIAEIGTSGDSGDVKICLTLKSSDVQYQMGRKEPNVSRSHSDRLPMRSEYKSVTSETTGAGANERSLGRSITLPRIHVTAPAGQSEEAKCKTLGRTEGASTDLTHEYMPMGSVLYTDMDYALGMNNYEN